MTKTNMDLSELLAKHDQGDLSRAALPEPSQIEHGIDPCQYVIIRNEIA